MMEKEELNIAVISDKESAPFREEIEKDLLNEGIDVILKSRTKISRINNEIKPCRPKISLVIASDLYNTELFNDLWGFLRKLKRNLPETKVIVYSRLLSRKEKEKIFSAGVTACISEGLGHKFLGPVVKEIINKQSLSSENLPFVTIKKDQLIK